MTMRQEGREPVEEPQRGVFEDVNPFTGTRSFRVVNAAGVAIREERIAADHVWPGTITELEEWLELHDPERPPLKIA